jgi:hypothetical protein
MEVSKIKHKLIISLGVEGDQQIKQVIKNLNTCNAFNKEVYSIVPFSQNIATKHLNIQQLRKDQPLTTKTILTVVRSKIAEIPQKTNNVKLQIAFVGHYNSIDKQEYFSALNATQTPELQREIIQTIPVVYLNQISSIEFKYYVCFAYRTLRKHYTQMQDDFVKTKKIYKSLQITVKASSEAIIANPVFFNVRKGLKPEANKYRSKYTNKVIPKEYKASEEWLSKVSCLNRRVIANITPPDFIPKYLKTSENVERLASLFVSSNNSWRILRF